MNCRYCDLPVHFKDKVLTTSYWGGVHFIAHEKCKVEGYKAEAMECQTIDADCCNCKHFARGELIQKGIHAGVCNKFNKPTKSFAMFASGHECFEHRRAV